MCGREIEAKANSELPQMTLGRFGEGPLASVQYIFHNQVSSDHLELVSPKTDSVFHTHFTKNVLFLKFLTVASSCSAY